MKKLLLLFLPLLLICCKSEPAKKSISGEALGTSYHITYFSEKELALQEDLDSIFKEINNSMSTYQEDSDISEVNRGNTSVKVDEMFQEVFKLSVKVYKETGGYFDPTVGNLVNLYGFGPEKGLISPDSSNIDSLMTYVGLDKVKISEEGSVQKDYPEVYLDFNAIAKGYAIDVIGNHLEATGVENYLVELGGELLALGKNKAKDAPWTVGIDDPAQEEGQRTIRAVIELRDRAMATSGNYRKFRIDSVTGNKYVHTINPLTGYPEKSNLLSATVLAENCALADAYATAFMALGLERSKTVLQELGDVDAYLIFTAENGQMKEFLTDEFQKVLLQN